MSETKKDEVAKVKVEVETKPDVAKKEKGKDKKDKVVDNEIKSVGFTRDEKGLINFNPIIESSININNQVIELKDFDIKNPRYNIGSTVCNIFTEIYSNENNENQYKHVIIGDTLIVIDNCSRINITGNNWFGIGGDITYIDEHYSNVPDKIIELTKSSITCSNLDVVKRNVLNRTRIDVKGGIYINNSSLGNSFVRSEYASKFTSVITEDLNINSKFNYIEGGNYLSCSFNVENDINIQLDRYERLKDVYITGNQIEKLTIKPQGRIHNLEKITITYYGNKDKTPVSIVLENRIHSGYFTAISPIAFCNTKTGILVGGQHFTYEQMKSFKNTIWRELLPKNSIMMRDRAAANGFDLCGIQEPTLPSDDVKTLITLEQLIYSSNVLGDRDIDNQYNKVDSLLPIKNGLIASLAEQIFSRLRLYKELENII